MTYTEAIKRYTDLLDRLADLIEGCEWDEPEDPDEDEEPDEDTATKVYAIGVSRAA